MLTLKTAYIDVHRSQTGSGVDFTIPGSDIESVEHARRINEWKDEGTIVVHNDDGQYSTSDKQITLGDRLDVFVAPEGSPTAWGADLSGWGYGGWGGERRLWSAMVQDPTYVRHGTSQSTLELGCTDFVFGVLASRIVFDAYEETAISGSDDAILNTVLEREAPELDLQHVADVGQSTSIAADGTNLLEFCIKLARRSDAVMYGYRDRLVFDSINSIATEFAVDPETDVGPIEVPFKGGSVKNVIRVDGSTDHAIDDQQTTQDGYTTVTESSRATVQVSTRKSQLDRVELWTNPQGTNESINIRVQKDDGGSPIAVGDTESDIDSAQLSYEFLATDDFTTFLLNEHTLPEPNPWLIIESDGPDGQQIGIRTSDSKPTYKAHYPFPVSTRQRDSASVKQYRTREQYMSQDNLDTLDAASDLAGEALSHRSDPEHEATADAISRRVHRLDPGEVVGFDLSRERLEGDYMITEMSEVVDGHSNQLTATLTAQEVDSI